MTAHQIISLLTHGAAFLCGAVCTIAFIVFKEMQWKRREIKALKILKQTFNAD